MSFANKPVKVYANRVIINVSSRTRFPSNLRAHQSLSLKVPPCESLCPACVPVYQCPACVPCISAPRVHLDRGVCVHVSVCVFVPTAQNSTYLFRIRRQRGSLRVPSALVGAGLQWSLTWVLREQRREGLTTVWL